MLITVGSNIGSQIGNNTIPRYWNNRSGRRFVGQHGDSAIGGSPKFIMRPQVVARYVVGYVIDINRNWGTPYTDIVIAYDSQVKDTALTVGGTATGHTIKINDVAQTTTYWGGSASGQWTFRIPVAVDNDDAITYSYSQSAGATINVLGSVELAEIVNQQVSNYLTKRIRFVVRKSDNSVCANETVKLGIFSYANGIASDVDNYPWMMRTQAELAITDSNGQVDILYRGGEGVGMIVYVVIIRTNASPSESLIWTTVVQ